MASFFFCPQVGGIASRDSHHPRMRVQRVVAAAETSSQTVPPPADGSPRRRYLVFYVVTALFALAILYFFREVLLPFLIALVIAYVLDPVVRLIERISIRGRCLPRWSAVASLYLVLLGVLGLGIGLGVPRLALEVERLAKEGPRIVSVARDEWIPELETKLRSVMAFYKDQPDNAPGVSSDNEVPEPLAAPTTPNLHLVPTEGGGFEITLPTDGILIEKMGDHGFRVRAQKPTDHRAAGDVMSMVSQAAANLVEALKNDSSSILGTAQHAINSTVRGIFTFFITLMLSAYLLATSDKIFGFFRSLVQPRWRRSFDRLMERVDTGLGGVVRGQIAICGVNGVLSGIGFYLLDLPYWPLLTLIATVFSIIPIFGSIASSVPAVLVGLQVSPITGVLALAWIILIHQIEANFLNPKILGDAAKVHPVLVVFALIAGERFYGIAGALLAVPALSIVQSLFLHYRDIALGSSSAFRAPPVPEVIPSVGDGPGNKEIEK